MKAIRWLVLGAGLCASFVVTAQSTKEVVIKDVWLKETVVGQQATGVYANIESTVPMQLVGVRSPIAKEGQLHEMAMDKDVMQMRQIKSLPITPKRPLQLTSRSYHGMLFGLKDALKTGEQVPIIFEFVRDGSRQTIPVTIKAEVRSLVTPISMHMSEGKNK